MPWESPLNSCLRAQVVETLRILPKGPFRESPLDSSASTLPSAKARISYLTLGQDSAPYKGSDSRIAVNSGATPNLACVSPTNIHPAQAVFGPLDFRPDPVTKPDNTTSG